MEDILHDAPSYKQSNSDIDIDADRLINLLEDDEFIRDLLKAPVDVIEIEHVDILRQLSKHFCSRPRADKEDDEEEDEATKKEGRSLGQDPFRPIVNIRVLRVAEEVKDHVRKYGDNVRSFLDDRQGLYSKVGEYNGRSVGDAFMASYQYTVALAGRMGVDRIRWCFSMLMFLDLSRLILPEGSGNGKWGPQMTEKVRAFLGPVLDSGKITLDDAKKQLNLWSRCGRRINRFIERFGPGCVFFLAPYLSQCFLDRKMRDSGDHFTNAMKHLKALNLKHLAEEYNTLGENIRAEMIQPYKEALELAILAANA